MATFPPASLIQMRRLNTYALYIPPKVVARTISTLDLLLSLINSNSKSMVFTLANLKIDFPVVEKYQGKNSKVTVSSTSATLGFSGSTTLRYNRFLIERAFQAPDNTLPVVSVNTTIYAMLPALNTQLKSKLTTDDIEDAPVLAGAERLTLVAKSTAFMYIPGSSVLIGKPEPTT